MNHIEEGKLICHLMSLKCVLNVRCCLSVQYVLHVNFQKGVVAGFHYLI